MDDVTFETARQGFVTSLNTEDHMFSQTLAFIDSYYHFTPSAFKNGAVSNEAEQNQGSCKTLALGHLLGLNPEQTLLCFGEHYRDVLSAPNGDNHANIRNFMKFGASGVTFKAFPLTRK